MMPCVTSKKEKCLWFELVFDGFGRLVARSCLMHVRVSSEVWFHKASRCVLQYLWLFCFQLILF
jgi:hypothetical protein